jgi:hypothetical protein
MRVCLALAGAASYWDALCSSCIPGTYSSDPGKGPSITWTGDNGYLRGGRNFGQKDLDARLSFDRVAKPERT